MLISDARRMVFVHVQKTGGVTVQRALEAALPDSRSLAGGRHATYGEILGAEPGLANYWSFGFVRNPWARLVSWYDMASRCRSRAEAGSQAHVDLLLAHRFLRTVAYRYRSFEEFVMVGPDELRRLATPQVEYLRHDGRRVDFVGRTESLSEDLARVLDHLGLPVPEAFPRRNATTVAVDHRDRYTPASRERVARLFAADVQEFGYTF